MENVRPGRIRASAVREGDILVTPPSGESGSKVIGTVDKAIPLLDGSFRWIVSSDYGTFIIPGPSCLSTPANAFIWIDVPRR